MKAFTEFMKITIMFQSDIVDDFLRVLRFPPPIKLTNTI